MKSEHREDSKSLTNVGDEQNRDHSNFKGELVEREQIQNSPIWMVGNQVDGYFICVGRQRLSGVFDTKEECRKMLEDDFWNILGNYVLTLMDLREQTIKEVKEAQGLLDENQKSL